ncbi:alanine/ornithine racemase family PLP-dependent enzyme [Photobacterium sanguinicancri]|uniref:Alanine/ornithine racemase family PLP-dependent enzyme n=1 Tax=Photobacterium sanguinicancri TaxID=875932 RepID=A0AAW7Y6C4_9GAMM|nr:alanine/ornithine racemase family PLP-dependent enzyme [Photobacterium sanguinicancri]MDO6544017.1 alanine/ornithine racemase family PLP-dependent enzyme [Photobacterium sanguinicancri]
MNYPRIDIDCNKIYHNAQFIINQLALKSISVTPVTKVCLGHPVIAQTLIDAGAKMLADSRVQNIQRMVLSGITVPKMLIRTPMFSQVASVVKYCDISLNTEIDVIKRLSCAAKQARVNHDVIIMIELGDLREGIMPNHSINFIREVISLPNINLRGIGSNLTCRYGIAPDDEKMKQLSDIADEIESTFGINLEIISGGNSASINWALAHRRSTRINNLRIGEAIFLGCVPLEQPPIEGLHQDAITLTAEIIESKVKPSLPWGKRGENAFGEKDIIQDRGVVSQAILALGRQDVCIAGLKAPDDINIISSTSDHLIIESARSPLVVGAKIRFSLDYSALLSSMSSDFIYKFFNKSKRGIT